MDYFEPVLAAGQDILYICFSSALSGTYQTALIAAAELREKYPERRLEVIDSKCASIGEGLLFFCAGIRKKQGYTLEQLADWITRNRDYVTHQFVVDDLEHLRRGGRIGSIATVIGSALSIKPYLRLNMDGALFVHAKVRGRKGMLDALLREIARNYDSSRDSHMIIAHADCPDGAKQLLDMILEQYNPPGRVIVSNMGPIIGSHVGGGTLALTFMGYKK